MSEAFTSRAPTRGVDAADARGPAREVKARSNSREGKFKCVYFGMCLCQRQRLC